MICLLLSFPLRGAMTNSGQTCVRPDHILVHADSKCALHVLLVSWILDSTFTTGILLDVMFRLR